MGTISFLYLLITYGVGPPFRLTSLILSNIRYCQTLQQIGRRPRLRHCVALSYYGINPFPHGVTPHHHHIHGTRHVLQPSTRLIRSRRRAISIRSRINIRRDVLLNRPGRLLRQNRCAFRLFSFLHFVLLIQSTLIVPLLMSIRVNLALITIINSLMVRPIQCNNTHRYLPILWHLTRPRSVRVLRHRFLTINRIHVNVRMIYCRLLYTIRRYFIIRFIFSLVTYGLPRQPRRLPHSPVTSLRPISSIPSFIPYGNQSCGTSTLLPPTSHKCRY